MFVCLFRRFFWRKNMKKHNFLAPGLTATSRRGKLGHGHISVMLIGNIIYIYGCVFFSGVQILVRVGSSSSANHTHESYPEPYPESYLRIIPPKITIMNVSFGTVWGCMASLVLMDVTRQLTSVGQIRWSLAAFTYLHDMSGEAGWLARWLAAWLARLGGYGNCCCWLGGWL